ncbi:MAG: hypothetical protein GYB67_02790 [Chloroflexi bacterium]|nr:hypothetical protein [Chloroflexota bacterium]
MPTPFTHLAFAQRLLHDGTLPAHAHDLLMAHQAAYWLGSVAADAHGLAGCGREATHFYTYDRPLSMAPWRAMTAQHPDLLTTTDPDQRAFVAGYVAHLAMDEVWTLHMTRPQFFLRAWASQAQRFLMLHIILIYMDERDLDSLADDIAGQLGVAAPDRWLPFLPDDALREWDDLIYRQIKPGGASETLDIFGPRVQKSPDELRAILDVPERMHADLWAHVTPAALARAETLMYTHARTQLLTYLDASSNGSR